MDTDMKSIIYFLSLYAPENIVGTVFAITDTPIDSKYDTKEVLDSYHRYNISIQYTEDHIIKYLGDKYIPLYIHYYNNSDKLSYLKCTENCLLYFNSDKPWLSIFDNKYINVDRVLTKFIYEYDIRDTTTSLIECISISDILKYHRYICENKWYNNYYKIHGINPVKQLVDKILSSINRLQCKILYISQYMDEIDKDIPDIHSIEESYKELNSILSNDLEK